LQAFAAKAVDLEEASLAAMAAPADSLKGKPALSTKETSTAEDKNAEMGQSFGLPHISAVANTMTLSSCQ